MISGRRLLAACCALLPMAVALPLDARAAAPEAAVVVRPVTVEVVDGPADDQRVRLDAALYVPTSASAERPLPAVILTHGFGGDRNGVEAEARQTAQAGYVVLAYSSRGFGASTGAISLGSGDYDVKDARQLVDFLAGRPEVLRDAPGDPRVGMTGVSYGGGIALGTAAADPRLDAVAPRLTWSSLEESLAPAGALKVGWTTIFFVAGLVGRPPAGPCGGFVPDVCHAYLSGGVQGGRSPLVSELLGRSSPDLGGRLRVPTLLAQGTVDTLFDLNQSVRTYEAARGAGAPARLLWHDGGHSTALGEPPGVRAAVLRWWQRWLRGDTSAEPGPGLEVVVAGRPTVTASAYPAGTSWRLLLSASGSLVGPGEGVPSAGRLSMYNPLLGLPAAHSETPGLGGRLDLPPYELPGQHLAWDSAPSPQDRYLVGIPRLRVRLASATGEALVFAKVYDVGPDGRALLVGYQARPTRLSELSGAPVEVDLAGMAHRLVAGHRLRLVLASTDAAYANRTVPDTYTVTLDPSYPAVLEVPFLPAG